MTPEQLRASILQYAAEGKLVKQNPNDEPASELIKKIEKEKNKLIKEGKIKKNKKLPAIEKDEKPFDIPDSWEWVRLGSILYNLDGKRVPVSVSERNKKGKVYDYYGASGVIDKIDNYIFSKPLLLISEDGANLLARRTPIAFIATGKYWVNNHAHVFDGINLLFLKYISIFIESIDVSKYVTGTAQPKLNQQNLNKILVAVPPLEEQKLIVAKIEKLMPLVDEYAESYNRLQKIDNEFEDKLKQSVLQYAMEGKLVKQNPSDEPASELVKASSMEKSHNESYKIPSSWEWVRLGSGVKFINGRAYKKTELLTDSNLTPVLRVGNLFTNSSWYYSDLKLDEDKYIDNGDLIYAWSASFGPRIWNGGHVIYHYHIWKTVIKKSIDKKFLYYFLSDPHNVLGETKLHGSTMKHVTKTNMEKLPFPLPPLEEQKRIVAKIEKIMNSINNH